LPRDVVRAMPRYRELAGIGGELVYQYTSSIGHDHAIEKHVAYVLATHLTHLFEKDLIPREAFCALAPVLLSMLREGNYIREGYEDVFEAAEAYLEERAGSAANYLWLGRSRNDHVSAALRLYAVEKLVELAKGLTRARRALLGVATRWGNVPVLLHTHQQPSQVGNIACLVLGWEEALSSVTQLALFATKLLARSPLGASAGAGTIAPIDPERLAELLGFESVLSSTYASGSRLDVALAVMVSAMFMAEASRIASDLITYSSPYLGVIVIPDEHVATSSAMPHKRNPVTLEVLRARAARVAGYALGVLAIMHGLPYIYNLDLQEANPLLYTALSDAVEASMILSDIFEKMGIDEKRSRALVERYAPVSVELAEISALREGKAFREAYREVAELLRKEPLARLAESLLGPGWVDKVLELRKTGCTRHMNLGRVEARIALDERKVSEIEERLVSSRKRIIEFLEEAWESCQRA